MSLSTDVAGASMAGAAPEGLAIQVRGLSKAFGRTPVLKGLELDVPWGEVLTVVGPNGSGKTTLIKVLATLSRPDEGSVRVAGMELSRMGQWIRRVIGVVTHEPLLYEALTGYENLRFVGRMFGLDRLDERITRVAESLGVASRLNQRVETLSHGLRKRLSIARALLHDPLVLLMDEPESGLDQEALAMLEAMVTDGSRPNRAVVMTTHNLERGVAMGHRLAILAGGGIAHDQPLDSAAGVAALTDAYLRHTGGAQ